MKPLLSALLIATCLSSVSFAKEKPNVILLFADDISARELNVYGSSVWSNEIGKDTQDPSFRAKTPVLDRLAHNGVWIKNAWAATSCSPSRAMMMTGRYAHLQKWWENLDYGEVITPEGKRRTWLLYESSPLMLGQVAQMAGYKTVWAGKTQMKVWEDEIQEFAFDEGVLTPGDECNVNKLYNSFRLNPKTVDGVKALINLDTGLPVKSYPMRSTYFKPHITILNEGGKKKSLEWWPNTPKSKEAFGLNTFGPDVEQDYCLDFMERQKKQGKPFFVYHTTHLGHDAFDWLHPESGNKWPGTPRIQWDGKNYHRTNPNITGESGNYDTHGTVTEAGLHKHIEYIDYITWRYLEKLKALGIENNTLFIFCADNGTSGYGKHQVDRQKGAHVPMIIYAPGMELTKQGEQDILVSLCDVLPTLADVMGAKIPKDYRIDGKSLFSYLTSEEDEHHDWIYSYKNHYQMIRGFKVLRDGYKRWWNVEDTPDDLTSFPEIKEWELTSSDHHKERKLIDTTLVELDNYETEHDAPGVPRIKKALPKH